MLTSPVSNAATLLCAGFFSASSLLTPCVANPCITKGDFGPLGEKCQRCQDSRHFCVPVEPPLYQHLQAAVTAREALARARRRGEANQAELADEARDAGLELTAALKRFDRNRNKTAGDRPAPRKKAAAASQGGSNELIVNELQSIRRAMLALVEVGKSVSIPSPIRPQRMLIECSVPAPPLRSG